MSIKVSIFFGFGKMCSIGKMGARVLSSLLSNPPLPLLSQNLKNFFQNHKTLSTIPIYSVQAQKKVPSHRPDLVMTKSEVTLTLSSFKTLLWLPSMLNFKMRREGVSRGPKINFLFFTLTSYTHSN